MSQQITGVHIFEKLGPIEWEDELIAIQALSVLTWKKYHGRIELYCNEEHLESLKKWGVDMLYDNINTELLGELPKDINKTEYWNFCKIFIPSRIEPPFVLVDTDLWITSPLEFDFNKSFISYHQESFDKTKESNFYSDFSDFIPEKYIGYFDETTKPTNVALLFFTDKELINTWYKTVCEIINEKRKTRLKNTQKVTFLEQWLLPMIAKKNNIDYGTFIPQIYDSTNTDYMDDNLWSPPYSKWSEEEKNKFEKIKHIWGLKKEFNDNNILTQVFDKVRNYITEFDINNLGLNKLKKLINDRSNYVEGKVVTGENITSILYCIPNILTDSLTNILIKRIEYLYNDYDDILIYVCQVNNNNIQNIILRNRIINLIGVDNYFVIDNQDITTILKDKNISICHYDISPYDTNFNGIMDNVFNDKKYVVVKSMDGIELTSNNDEFVNIPYPKINNIINLLPEDSDYKFDENSLPLHIKAQQRVFFRLDVFKSHVVCLGDITKIPNTLIELSKSVPDIIQFHFLNYINVDLVEHQKILSKLNPSSMIWSENVDFYDFIKISDLVIDFTNDDTTLVNEVISYGIRIMKLSRNNNENILKFKTLLNDKSKQIIPTNNNYFSRDYKNYYLSIRSKQ
jgi:hypothetical protein